MNPLRVFTARATGIGMATGVLVGIAFGQLLGAAWGLAVLNGLAAGAATRTVEYGRDILPSSVRAFFALGLVVAGSTLATARAVQAQPSEATLRGAVARATHRAGEDVRAIRRFDLTLADAVERAFERNRQVAVQRISPLVRDMQVATANAAFLPLASSSTRPPNPAVRCSTAGGSAAHPSSRTRAATTWASASG